MVVEGVRIEMELGGDLKPNTRYTGVLCIFILFALYILYKYCSVHSILRN